MEFTLTTPTVLFGMLSLLLLAYTNRFLGLAKLIRDLHYQWAKSHHAPIHAQIGNLRRRIRLIKWMQFLGALSILLALLSMASVYLGQMPVGKTLFGVALGALTLSSMLSLYEIYISTDALEIELADMEEKSADPQEAR